MNVHCLEVTPPSSLYDQPLKIVASGLTPAAKYTIVAHCKISGDNIGYQSYAHLVADSNGRIDLDSAPSSGGSYKDVNPMGLISYLKSLFEGNIRDFTAHQRMLENPIRSFWVRFSLYEQHLLAEKILSVQSLAQTSIKRRMKCPSVNRFEIRQGRIRATLFAPKDGRARPGVIAISGYNPGSLYEARASLLASHGYVGLALAYADYDDLPGKENMQLEYFLEAIEWFHSLSVVKKCGVIILGSCFGATFALHAAEHSSLIKAVVCVNSVSYIVGNNVNLRYQGKLLSAPSNVQQKKVVDGIDVHVIPALEEYAVKINKTPANVRFLFIVAESDTTFGPPHTQLLTRKLDEAGRRDHYKVISFPKVGHVFRPPYSPHAQFSPMKHGVLNFGGDIESFHKATVVCWQHILAFIAQTTQSANL